MLTVAKSAIFCAYSVRVIMYTRGMYTRERDRTRPGRACITRTQRRGFALQCFLVCVLVRMYNMHLVGNKVKALGGRERERRLRVATWNFSGLGSERKNRWRLASC